MRLRLLLLSVVVGSVALLPTAIYAKSWRGITPLRSTRADLTKAFGKSPDENKIRANYDVDGDHVYVVFSSGLDYYPECASSLPFDTVVLIQVRPERRAPISSYSADETKFEIIDPSSPPNLGYKGYIDAKEGVVYLTSDDLVEQIDYFASAEDNYLCPRYSEDPASFIRLHVDFFPTVDEYGIVRFNEERARLDNFGIQLTNATKSKGYIIVYPGGNITKKAAEARGKRACEYLISRIKLSKERVELIVGPRQERFSVHLDMYPKNMKPYVREEIPSPTVIPKKKK